MSSKKITDLEDLVSIDFDTDIEELKFNDSAEFDSNKNTDTEDDKTSKKSSVDFDNNKVEDKKNNLKSDKNNTKKSKIDSGNDENEDVNEDIENNLDDEIEEDEIEEDKTEEDEINNENSKSDHSISKKEKSPALIFAKFLKEKGVVTLENQELEKINELVSEGNEEDALEYLFSSEVNKRVEEIKNSYDDDIQEYLLLRDYGVSPEKAMTLVKNKNIIEQITEEDIEEENNLNLRKDVIKSYLKISSTMNDEDIEEYIETLIDSGKDYLWAKKGLKAVKEHNNKLIEEEKKRIKQEEEEMNKRVEEAKNLIKKTVMETNEILGNKVNASTKSKIIKMLIEPAGKDSQGNPVDGIIAWLLKDPVKNRINLAYAISSGILDGKLSGLKKKVKTEILQDLESSLFEKNNLIGGTTNISNSSDGIKALQEIFGED